MSSDPRIDLWYVRTRDVNDEQTIHAPINDDPARWALATYEIEDHLVSICVERREGDANTNAMVKLHRVDLARMLRRPTTDI